MTERSRGTEAKKTSKNNKKKGRDRYENNRGDERGERRNKVTGLEATVQACERTPKTVTTEMDL